MQKKKGVTAEQLELIPPKFPVPELSEQMKMHVQRTAHTSIPQTSKTETSAATTVTSTHSATLTTQVTKSPVEIMTSAYLKPKVTTPPKTVDMDPIDKGKLLQKEILNNNVVLNQYKEIEKSFLRQQREMRGAGVSDRSDITTSFSDVGRKSSVSKPEPVELPKVVPMPAKVIIRLFGFLLFYFH